MGELIQELWSTNSSSKQMAIDTMAIWTKKNPASTKPLEEAVRTKNALEPLIQAVKKASSSHNSPKWKSPLSSSTSDEKLLLYRFRLFSFSPIRSSLQLIKRVTADPSIVNILFDTEEQSFLTLLIDLMRHSDPKIQKTSVCNADNALVIEPGRAS